MPGSEIIRDMNEGHSPGKAAAERFLGDVIRADGGAPIHNGSENEQRSLDST